MKHFFLLLFLIPFHVVHAQRPDPAPPQERPILLSGATLHTGTGEVIENAVVGFAEGKITLVGAAAATTFNPADFRVIDVSGQHLYPGLILPNAEVGLVEISAVRATNDEEEVGELNPNVRALIAYNTDSDIIPTIRSNGILTVQTTPRGSLLSGASSLMQLDGWNWEDAAVKADDGLHIYWPNLFTRSGWWAEPGGVKKNENRDKEIQELESLFSEAAAYNPANEAVKNLKLTALKGLFDGSQRLYLHASYGKEIVEAVQFALRHGVQHPVVIGGQDAWMVTDFLKEHNIPVVLSTIHALPPRPESNVDHAYELPHRLQEAGITVALDYDDESYFRSRSLPFLAGTAAAYGVDREEALKMVTSNPAKIMGIDDRLGTVEVGKDATLVVSQGDLLDMRTSHVTQAFINGREISLDNKHKRLYETYRKKYQLGE
ncbi:Imidazolonepropionase [Catalinimonas alkaloidigena]|uniref:Imidazolonepropionase n=1 Tax=Catalinimonas alkaloidigena TaxID=1075417 RepID=A0A1G9AY28_9BACT|nr:amidohydrolase family protein [Catalinimonas alkaloidigena]SDK32231.1 Imidazolonepropionase [Catalinimonas alkaloidigena]